MTPRSLLGGAFLTLSVAAHAQTDISVLETYICNANGVRQAARVGEPFWVATRFRVVGTPNSSYKYRVEAAYAKVESPRLSFGTVAGEYYVYWGPIPTLMDGPVEVRATLDPEKKVRESNRLNNSATFTVEPVPPSTPIELFDARQLQGRIGVGFEFKRGSAWPESLSIWMPLPTQESFQRPLDRAPAEAFQEIVTDPFQQPILVKTWTPTLLAPVHQEMEVGGSASSIRANLSLLRQFNGPSDPEMSKWLGPEDLIEVGRPEFAKWVGLVIDRERPPLPTVDTAMALYRSILRNCSYDPKPGILPSALNTLRKKKGDCGALSSLFVALCRTVGIPARTVAGFGEGRNNWHVWAEFHVSGAGWVPVDPAYAEGRLAKGADLPIYFGVVPELNKRVATAFGLDRKAGGRSLPMLQSPALFWQGRNVKVHRFSPFSELAVR